MDWLHGLFMAITPMTMLSMLIGVFIGIVLGVIPGLGSSVGFCILLPFMVNWSPAFTFAMFIGIWAADNYGGSISSILINVPGTSAAVATCFDGHPMAKQGKAGTAIGLAMGASFFGGVVGTLVLMFFAPPLARLAVYIGPPQYALLGLIGLTLVGGVGGKDPTKGLVSAALGLMLSFVGYNLVTGFTRFDFGRNFLYGGIDFTLGMIALFGIASLVEAALDKSTVVSGTKVTDSTWRGFLLAFKYRAAIIRGTVVGILVGAAPGIGVSVACMLAYAAQQRSSPHPELYGTGMPEGVVAPESANNAVQPGSLIPTLTLGIPGSPTAAIFLGVLIMYGFQPGMNLFQTQGPLVWSLFWSIIIACICFVILGLAFGNLFAKIARVPSMYLVPAIMVICMIAAFTIGRSMEAVTISLMIAMLSFLMTRFKYPMGPAVLGLVLGPIIETNYDRALMIAFGSHTKAFFTGWLNWAFWAGLLLLIFVPVVKSALQKRKAKLVAGA